MTGPLAIDLYCGLGGWTDGLLAEGWDVIGFDIERHAYGGHRYPARLVLQDVLTLHGAQFKDADLIVASPPCTEFSYMAMPWSRAKQIARALRGEDAFPEGYTGSRTVEELTALFRACFRIQAEASAAKGEHIPLVVENVQGAQEWVGRAPWHFGSFYLWGDVPALMPSTKGMKNTGGSWFNIGSPGPKGTAQNPMHGYKVASQDGGRRTDPGKGARFTSRDCGMEGVKQRGSGREWFAGEGKIGRLPSASPKRKAASAMIAKIPFDLARHIGRVYKPVGVT